jgi:hypothetical protein
MSHREEPRSGRGCFGAVVVVPFLALGGMFALIALTGSPQEAPLAAPPPSRPTSQWWTEPFETGSSLSTVTETVVVEGAAREVRAARLATSTRVAVSTVTETVRAGGGKPPVAGRNEPPPGSGEETPVETLPSSSDSSSGVVTSTSSVVPGPPVLEPPASSAPAEPVVTPTPSTPRSEEPASPGVPTTPSAPPPGSTSPAPPCERGEPGPSGPSGPEEPGVPGESSGEVSVGGSLELRLSSPAEESSTSSAPLAGV